jgi:hypothetical protein
VCRDLPARPVLDRTGPQGVVADTRAHPEVQPELRTVHGLTGQLVKCGHLRYDGPPHVQAAAVPRRLEGCKVDRALGQHPGGRSVRIPVDPVAGYVGELLGVGVPSRRITSVLIAPAWREA